MITIMTKVYEIELMSIDIVVLKLIYTCLSFLYGVTL